MFLIKFSSLQHAVLSGSYSNLPGTEMKTERRDTSLDAILVGSLQEGRLKDSTHIAERSGRLAWWMGIGKPQIN